MTFKAFKHMKYNFFGYGIMGWQPIESINYYDCKHIKLTEQKIASYSTKPDFRMNEAYWKSVEKGIHPNSIQFFQFNFYFDLVNIYVIVIHVHHWPANSTELIEAGQWLQNFDIHF